MNKAIITGRLTKTPDIRKAGDKTVATLTVAVKRRFKDKDGNPLTDFLTVVAWNKTAENCARYLATGSRVGVVGEIQTRTYEKDGVKKYITEIIADEVEFLDTKKDKQEDKQDNGFVDIEDSDLPF